jgi:23S rRNA (cytidine2498-2'-O)-methyltransferase
VAALGRVGRPLPPEARSVNRVLFSTSAESYDLAAAELRRRFGRIPITRVGPDTGVAGLGPLGVVADECRPRPLLFVKHLTRCVARLDAPTLADLTTAAAAAVGTERIAVQAWVSGISRVGYGPAEAAAAVARRLRDRGVAVSRAGEEHTLSVLLASRTVYLGVNRTADSVADWPGGRVRLRRRPEQISRAEFKLEEVLAAYPLELSGLAVDYGAAPGGWTRILRTYGMAVIAVDPGDLHPLVAADPGVTHLRTTAGEFLRTNRARLDLVVDDMRMDPALSSRLVAQTAPLLRPGGHALITLKTGARRVLDTVDRCLRTLGDAYDIVFARQLHHNRRELTVLLRRPPPG